jgi:intergrase/recombinase
MTEPITNGNILEKPIRDESGRIIGGVLNPNGRPKGSRNFYTDFQEAIKRIKDEKTGEAITEIDIIAIGMKKMLKGDERFEGLYKDLLDRVYGRATQPTDITSGGEKITTIDPSHIAIAEKYEEELKQTIKNKLNESTSTN